MNYIAFIYAFNIILISRLGYVLRDTPLKKSDLRYLIIFQFLAFLIFEFTWMTILLLMLVLIINPLIYYAENQDSNHLLRLIKIRIGVLCVYLFIFSFTFAEYLAPDINPEVTAAMGNWGDYFIGIHWLGIFLQSKIQVTLMGLLLIINEVNLVIRLYFQTFDLLPRKEEAGDMAPEPASQAEPSRAPIDIKEYNAGRVIGILERVLIYFFVLNNHLAAIGFVIAAKSFTRFRELNKRHFAEYVLIGTLLSCSMALGVATLVDFLRYVL